MKALRTLVEFLRDLLIGDRWQITAAVAVILAGGVVLLRLDLVPATMLAISLAAIVMIVPLLMVVLEARAGMRRDGTVFRSR